MAQRLSPLDTAAAESCSSFEQDSESVALAGSASSEEPDLHNGRDPHYNIKHERLEHRVIIYLKAEGLSNKEVAEVSGFTPVAVSNILRQPWAKRRVLEIIQSKGSDAVETVLKSSALDSIYKLIELRDSPLTQPETQRKSANDLLDRLFGKPNQPVQHSGNLDLTKLSDEELARIIASGSGSAGSVDAATGEEQFSRMG